MNQTARSFRSTLPRFRQSLLVLLSLTTLSFASHAENISVQHAQGTAQVPAQPEKVVVFDLATLDTLRTLKIADAVIGVPETPYPKHLSHFQEASYTRVGSLFEPNYEVVNQLKPELIIVGGRSGPKQADLAKLAPTIDLTVNQENPVSSVDSNVRTLGKIFGKEAEAETELKKMHDAIAALKQKASGAGTGLIVLTTGGKMSAYGPGSRFGIIHDVFGFKPAVTDLKESNHGQAISFEFILKTNPDWIFVVDRDAAIGSEGQAAAKLLDNALVRNTKAWKKEQVVYLDSFNWYLLASAGLTAMQENIQQLSDAVDAHKHH